MAGRGRGRGLTLPAWMTESGGEIAPLNKPEMTESNDAAQPGNIPSRDLFTDDSAELKTCEPNFNGIIGSNAQPPAQTPAFMQTAPMRAVSGAPPPPPGPPPARNVATAPVAVFPPMSMAIPMGYPPMFPPTGMQGFHLPPMMGHMQPMGMGMAPSIPPGMLLPGAYPPVAPSMVGMGAPPGGAVVQDAAEPAATAAQPAALNDPNNDVKSWSEHEGEDGRTYWHNCATKKSTYDKPECLKCPEERSIPPCRWKEYSADGKIYYSDGSNSSWTMPEEFKEWKDRVSAAVARRKAALEAVATSTTVPAQAAGPPGGSQAPHGGGAGGAASSSSRPRGGDSNKKPSPSGYAEAERVPAKVYASKEEALEAFKALLDDVAVSSTMKFRDVQDLCSGDARWNALRSVGERKQSLAEYQTKKMKQEKEEKKVAARRARDAFFQMLAECVAIDARSRWRDCSQQLMEDYRFKGVENERDREEYFNDFVTELAKKERDDSEKIKREAKEEIDNMLHDLLDRGVIETRSKWADVKSKLAEFLENTKFASLDETDKRRMFHDYMDDLEAERRNEERKIRAEKLETLDKKKAEFRDYLVSQFETSVLRVDVRWKVASSLVCDHETYKELVQFTEGDATLSRGAEPRDVFDAIVGDLREEARIDKRVIRDILDQERISIEHDTDFDSLVQTLTSVVQRKRDSTEFERDKDLQVLDKILSSRLQSLRRAYDDVHDTKAKLHEEELRKRQKREDRYLDLLDDYYYRSDHVDVTWEEAKRELDRHSAYRDLDRSDRRKLFDAHMDELREKLNGKLKKQGAAVSDKGTDSDDEYDDVSISPHKRKASESDLASGDADRDRGCRDSNGVTDDSSRDDAKACRHPSKMSRMRDRDGVRDEDEGDDGERHSRRHSGRKSSHRDLEDRDMHRSKKRPHRDDGSGDEEDDDDWSTSSRSRKRGKEKKEKKDKDRDRDRKHKHKRKKDRSSSHSPHERHRSSRDAHKSKKTRSRS